MPDHPFPSRLRALRNARRQSQAALAEAIGFAQTTVSQWEAGEYEPALLAISKLATHFSVTADYLCGITDEPERLPPNAWLVDADLHARAMRGDLAGIDGDTHLGAPIPAGARIVDSNTFHRMLGEVRAALRDSRKRKRN